MTSNEISATALESTTATTPDLPKNNDWPGLISLAWQRRQEILDQANTDSWRVFHGYYDGCNGVVIEKFHDIAIIEYKKDIRYALETIASALCERYKFKMIIAKGHQSLGLKLSDRQFVVYSCYEEDSEPTDTISNEFNVKYHISLDAVHNSGLYLDARPVRQWLLKNSSDRRVLNLFSFAGSLGLASVIGGARNVIHLDKSADLLSRIQKSYSLNEKHIDNRDFMRGDIYKHLPRAIKNKQKFDGIILDPPPKVYASHYAENRPRGQDFKQLTKLCSKLLSPNAWLVCLFHRFDASWDECEQEVVLASNGALTPSERFTSGNDFPEANDEHKLRVSVFRTS